MEGRRLREKDCSVRWRLKSCLVLLLRFGDISHVVHGDCFSFGHYSNDTPLTRHDSVVSQECIPILHNVLAALRAQSGDRRLFFQSISRARFLLFLNVFHRSKVQKLVLCTFGYL